MSTHLWNELICSACRHIFFSRYYDRTTSTEEKAVVRCPMCGSYGVKKMESKTGVEFGKRI